MKMKFSKKDLINEGSGGLEIKIEGCPGDPTEDEPGTSLFIEYYEGKVQVHVWDGRGQDCQTITLKQS
jgi:hypothetical protein